MKSITFILLAALLGGCAQKSDHRIAALEAEQARIKTNFVELIELVKLHTLHVESMTSNSIRKMEARQAGLTNLVTLEMLNLQEDLEIEIKTQVRQQLAAAAPTNALARRAVALTQPRPAPAPARPMKNGVPAEVYDRIAASAEREWPGNFAMQKFEIDRQIGAYQTIR